MDIWKYSALCFLLFCSVNSSAQQKWFETTAGTGLSFATTKASPLDYQTRILPHLGVTAFIPFSKTVALKTGVIYQQKGNKTAGALKDSLDVFNVISSEETFHYLSIPLQLAFNFSEHSSGLWRVAAGMSYGFLVKATKSIDFQTYDGGTFVGEDSKSFNQAIGIESSQNYPGLPAQEGTALYVFTPAVRLDLSYQWQRQFVFSAFYEYNLQDNRMRIHQNARTNLHYTGISVGVIIR